NLQRGVDEGRDLDLAYLASLGNGAVPVLMRRLEDLPAIATLLNSAAGRPQSVQADERRAACEQARPLLALRMRANDGDGGWRRWNAAVAAAKEALAMREEDLASAVRICAEMDARTGTQATG